LVAKINSDRPVNHTNAIAIAKWNGTPRLKSYPVQLGSMATAEVADRPPTVDDPDRKVLPRNGWMVNAQVCAVGAPRYK
jgi:hypothetical protein